LTPARELDRTDVKVLASLALIPLALFPEVVTGQRVFYERDILGYWFSQAETIVRVLAQGSWPLWDPYEGFGRPLLAGPQAQLLYPFTWLDLLLPPAAAYALLVIVHTWVAAAGAYVLMRTWGLSRASAAVAGLAFSCSGPFISSASLFHHFVGAALIPWVLAAFQAFLNRRTTRAALFLGMAAGLQILAGSGDMVVLSALSAVILLADAVIRDGRAAWSSANVARIALAAAFALGLSAAQWVPTLAVARSSNRSHMPPEFNLYWSVHPASLGELFVPQALPSLPLSDSLRAVLFESREPFLSSLYLGLSAILLLVPLAAGADRRRTAVALGGFAFFLLAALGRHAPLLPLLLKLPVVSLFRYPVKYMLGAAVFWAGAAAIGFDAWLRPWSPGQQRAAGRMTWVAAAAAIAAIVSAEALRLRAPHIGEGWVNAPPDWRPLAFAPLVWKLRRAGAVAALAALLLAARRHREGSRGIVMAAALLVVTDLIISARPVNELAAPELAAYRPAALAVLQGPADRHRLFVAGPAPAALNRSLTRGPAGWPAAWSWALGLQQTLEPPSGARWGLRGSYEADFTGMARPETSAAASVVVRYRNTPFGLRLLRMGGVTEVVSLLRDPVPGIVPVGQFETVFKEPVHVARVPDPLPRAYIVGRAVVAKGDEFWRAVAAPEFDLATTVLLDEDPGAGASGGGFPGAARLLDARPDHWRVETEAVATAYLVVTDANAPGWRAEIDGHPTHVYTANRLFRAVQVPAGRHTVDMRYRPSAVAWGLAASALSLMAMAVIFVRTRPGSPNA
jgi:Bacterial membrane protein YfhO